MISETVQLEASPEGARLLARMLREYKSGSLGGTGNRPGPSRGPRSAVPSYVVQIETELAAISTDTPSVATGCKVWRISGGALADTGAVEDVSNVLSSALSPGRYVAVREPISGRLVIAGGGGGSAEYLEYTTGQIKQVLFGPSGRTYLVDRLDVRAQQLWDVTEVEAAAIYAGSLAVDTTVDIRRDWKGDPRNWDQVDADGEPLPIPHTIVQADVCGMAYEGATS